MLTGGRHLPVAPSHAETLRFAQGDGSKSPIQNPRSKIQNRWAAHTWARWTLSQASDDADLESELLLRHVLGIDRAALYAGWQELLGPAERRRFRHVVRRRVSGLPTAYLLGRREFYGVELAVDRRVL
ncbi:MAG: hypothetical protein HYY05_03495, partial [Chloroflexi bacterium]|nr:hypothetical protein [Chloroflexota bacterium]